MKRTKQAYIPSDIELDGFISLVQSDAKFGARNNAIVHLSYFAGLRAKEISELDVENIYTEQGAIRPYTYLTEEQTKGNEGRRITLKSPRLIEALSEYHKVVKRRRFINRSLFVSSNHGRMSANTIAHLFKRLYKVANLQCSSHSGRRYFATKMGNNPHMTTAKLMKLGGWKSPDIAMAYVEANEEEIDLLVEDTFS